MARTFSQWLGDYSDAMGLDDVGRFTRDRTLIVHDVICTFVHPCGDLHDIAAVLLDAGMISTVAKHDLVELALSRNLENFLLGAPLFLRQPVESTPCPGSEVRVCTDRPVDIRAVA